MVLSRKKAKQKLQDLLAGGGEQHEELQDIRQRFTESNSNWRTKRKEKVQENKKEEKKDEEDKEVGVEEKGEKTVQETSVKGEEGTENNNQKKKKKPEKKKEKKTEEEKIKEEEERAERKRIKREKREKRRELKKNVVVEDEEKGEENEVRYEQKVVELNNDIHLKESEENLKKVYAGGIPYYSTEDDIRSFFDGCGTIVEVDCMTFPESGKFRGIAILTFKTDAAAKRAVALDGADMGGFYLKMRPYKDTRAQKSDFAPEIVEGYDRIYVGNLSWDITEDDLKKLFSECKISSIRFGTDKETGNFKGYAHIDFSDSASLSLALKLDQKVVCGRPVRIRCAVPKKDGKTVPASTPADNTKIGDGLSLAASKKRRMCYECGLSGHLSSSCPNKNAAQAGSDDMKAGSGSNSSASKNMRLCYECGLPGHLSSACPNKRPAEVSPDDKKDNNASNMAPSNKKRRTCYECGISGHLSSECPNKKVAEISSDDKKYSDASNDEPSKKQQTCYECAIPGHLSSECPNNTIVEVSPDDKKTGDVVKKAPSKKRRRTCYECGIPGHLSSECPNRKMAEVNASGVNT